MKTTARHLHPHHETPKQPLEEDAIATVTPIRPDLNLSDYIETPVAPVQPPRAPRTTTEKEPNYRLRRVVAAGITGLVFTGLIGAGAVVVNRFQELRESSTHTIPDRAEIEANPDKYVTIRAGDDRLEEIANRYTDNDHATAANVYALSDQLNGEVVQPTDTLYVPPTTTPEDER